MLTIREQREGPGWMIVGMRPDGSRLVIEQHWRQEKAERKAQLFRDHLEGYREIVVESICVPTLGSEAPRTHRPKGSAVPACLAAIEQLAAASEPISYARLSVLLGINIGNVYRAVQKLIASGHVAKDRRSRTMRLRVPKPTLIIERSTS